MTKSFKFAPVNEAFATESRNAELLRQLESKLDLTLNNDYRDFLIKFGGARPYPNILRLEGIVEGEPVETVVELLLPTESVQSHVRNEIYGRGTPVGYIIIAEDPGGWEFVMSLHASDRDSIYLWQHSTDIWGTETNNADHLHFVAHDFGSFLGLFSDNEEHHGWDHWNIPVNISSAVEWTLG